jgi:hypothetical protein
VSEKFRLNNNDRLYIKTHSPLLAGWHQEYFDPAPLPDTNLCMIHTAWNQNGRVVTDIQSGKKAEYQVGLTLKKSGSYMMLEIPIPSGCTYSSKNVYFPHSVHAEYFRNKIAVYYEYIPAGNYNFSIPLEVRYNGKFCINPVHLQNMYFREISGNSELKEMLIKQSN